MVEVSFEGLPGGWLVEQISPTEIHVYPVNDWRIHTLTDRCLCNPTVSHVYMGRRVTHHSFDGRETKERPSSGYVN